MELFHRKSKLLPGEADTASQVTLNIPDNRLWEWLRSWGPQELGDCRKHSELHACSSLAWASSTGVFLVQCTVDDHESVIAMIPWRKKYLVQAKLEIHTRLRALNWTRWHQLWFDFWGGYKNTFTETGMCIKCQEFFPRFRQDSADLLSDVEKSLTVGVRCNLQNRCL